MPIERCRKKPVRVNDFLTMEIEEVEGLERIQMQQGITWPALMALNSSFKLESKRFRKALFTRVKTYCDEKGRMPFFANLELQKKYPADLECTALFVGACVLNNENIMTDLDDIKRRIMPNGFFQTWIGRLNQPIDYTSQLMMCICYESAGFNVERTLEKTIKDKCKNFVALSSRDVYYVNPLYFIYCSLYLRDRGFLPNSYQLLLERFLETYKPANEVECAMIQKICIGFNLSNPNNEIVFRANPIISNGTRKAVTYDSNAVKEVFRASADLQRKNRFNRSMTYRK